MANMFAAPGRRLSMLRAVEALVEAMRGKRDWTQLQQQLQQEREEQRWQRGMSEQGMGLQERNVGLSEQQLAEQVRGNRATEDWRREAYAGVPGATRFTLESQAEQAGLGRQQQTSEREATQNWQGRPLEIPGLPALSDLGGEIDPRLAGLLGPLLSNYGAAQRQVVGQQGDVTLQNLRQRGDVTLEGMRQRGATTRAGMPARPQTPTPVDPNNPNINLTSINAEIGRILSDLEGGFDTLGRPKPGMPAGANRDQREADLEYWLDLRARRGGPAHLTTEDRDPNAGDRSTPGTSVDDIINRNRPRGR